MYSVTARRVSKRNPKQVKSTHTFFGKTAKAAKSALRSFFGKKKRNVEMGFYDSTGFHAIRASSDYSGARAGEKRARSTVAKRTRGRAYSRKARRARRSTIS